MFFDKWTAKIEPLKNDNLAKMVFEFPRLSFDVFDCKVRCFLPYIYMCYFCCKTSIAILHKEVGYT